MKTPAHMDTTTRPTRCRGDSGLRAPQQRVRPAKRRWARVSKVIRRVHLYLGLMMFPWVLLFGLSGMLFNHPGVGEAVEARPLPPPVLGEAGLEPWEARAVADRVLAQLNASFGSYRLDPSVEPALEGVAVLTATTREGGATVLVDPRRGGGVYIHRRRRAAEDRAPFSGQSAGLGPYTTQAIAEAVASVALPEDGRTESLRPHPKIAPELRFGVIDAEDQPWHVVVDLGSGALSGRPAERWPQIGWAQLLAKLHTTHHFTGSVGPLWFWALFEDLLGLTMMAWALTGLWMWWQLKPTRTLGVVAIVIALGVAAAVMGTTAEHLMFGDVAPVMGPGGDG